MANCTARNFSQAFRLRKGFAGTRDLERKSSFLDGHYLAATRYRSFKDGGAAFTNRQVLVIFKSRQKSPCFGPVLIWVLLAMMAVPLNMAMGE